MEARVGLLRQIAIAGPASLAFALAPVPTAYAASEAKWFTIDKRSDDEVEQLRRGDSVVILVAVPARLFVLRTDATAPKYKAVVPTGTLFMPAGDPADHKVCAAERFLGSAYWCLADTDNDGSFETYSEQQVFNELYFGSAMSDARKTPLSEPVSLSELDPFTAGPKAELGLRFEGGSEKGAFKFKTCALAKSQTAIWKPNGLYDTKCSKYAWEVRGQGFPREFEFHGTKIVAHGLEHGKLSLTIAHQPNVSTAIFVGSL
jgi:hypothetical protein